MNLTRMQSGTGGSLPPDDLGWLYLACTEVIHPIGANNKTDMFPPYNWTVSNLRSSCKRTWNVTPDEEFLRHKLDFQIEGTGSLARVLKVQQFPAECFCRTANTIHGVPWFPRKVGR